MSEQLKPCPFCGGEPKRSKSSGSEVNGYAECVIYKCVSCGCSRGARGDTSKGGYADNSTVEKRAVENWNARAADTALAAKDARIAELEQKVIGLEDYVASIPDYRHLCKELRDKLAGQQQAEPKGCTKPDCFPHCDCGTIDDYVPTATTHSEGGREVPEVVEFHWPEYHAEGMGCGLEDRGIRDRYEAMQHGWDCALDRCAEAIPDEPLMTVAQHSRIVAALRQENDELRAMFRDQRAKNAALRAAQPARQVGDEREAYEREYQAELKRSGGTLYPAVFARNNDKYVIGHVQTGWWAWSHRAALAPAAVAVVMPTVDQVMKVVMRYQWEDKVNVTGTTNWAANLGMAVVNEVARLNRRAIPEALLERIAKMPSSPEAEMDRYEACDELRSLLSQQQEGGV